MRHQLMRNGVELIAAAASLLRAAHRAPRLRRRPRLSRCHAPRTIVIATGTDATRDRHIPFDGKRIFTSDDILQLDRLPRTLTVVGAGVIGCEYASIFAALGRARDAGRQAPAPAAVRRRARSSTRCPTTCAKTASRCGWARASATSSRSTTSTAARVRHAPRRAASRSSPRRRSTASAARGATEHARPADRRARRRRARPARGQRALPDRPCRTSTPPAT